MTCVSSSAPNRRTPPLRSWFISWTGEGRTRSGSTQTGNRLVLPGAKAYERGAHQAAERQAQAKRRPDEGLGAAQAAAYESLVAEVPLGARIEGAQTFVEVSSVAPWTMLVVQPSP